MLNSYQSLLIHSELILAVASCSCGIGSIMASSTKPEVYIAYSNAAEKERVKVTGNCAEKLDVCFIFKMQTFHRSILLSQFLHNLYSPPETVANLSTDWTVYIRDYRLAKYLRTIKLQIPCVWPDGCVVTVDRI